MPKSFTPTRGSKLYKMVFERGKPKGKLQDAGKAPNRRGTKVRFHPDPEIFGPKARFQPERVFKMTRSKAYLFGGVEIRWSCAKELLHGIDNVPEEATFHFAEGLKDYLRDIINGSTLVHPDIFTGSVGRTGRHGSVPFRARSADGGAGAEQVHDRRVELTVRLGEDLVSAAVAGPGFLNLVMSDGWHRRATAHVLPEGFGGGGAQVRESPLQTRIDSLVYAYRTLGHTVARVNPLAEKPPENPLLTLREFGFSEKDLDHTVSSKFFLENRAMTLRDMIATLHRIYAGSIGAEFQHIQNTRIRNWVRHRLESRIFEPPPPREAQIALLRSLMEAETFEVGVVSVPEPSAA